MKAPSVSRNSNGDSARATLSQIDTSLSLLKTVAPLLSPTLPDAPPSPSPPTTSVRRDDGAHVPPLKLAPSATSTSKDSNKRADRHNERGEKEAKASATARTRARDENEEAVTSADGEGELEDDDAAAAEARRSASKRRRTATGSHKSKRSRREEASASSGSDMMLGAASSDDSAARDAAGSSEDEDKELLASKRSASRGRSDSERGRTKDRKRSREEEEASRERDRGLAGEPLLRQSKRSRTEAPLRERPLALPVERTFPRNDLKLYSEAFQREARSLKHAGDELLRGEEQGSKRQLAGLATLTDAVLLFMFGFWCDDTRHASAESAPSSSSSSSSASVPVNAKNWQSVFGLLRYVKGLASKQSLGTLASICCRIEAHVEYMLAMQSQHHVRRLSIVLTTQSATLSPDQLRQHADELAKASMGLSDALTRARRAFDESRACLASSPQALGRVAPGAYERLVDRRTIALAEQAHKMHVLPCRTAPAADTPSVSGEGVYVYSGPIDLHRTQRAIPHVVAFLRDVLAAWAKRHSLEALYRPFVYEAGRG